MHKIEFDGKEYEISDAAYDALADMGPAVASGEITGDEATAHILRCENLIAQ